MKKYKSFIPTLGAALLLSLGSAFCAQAADIGWVTEDGTWRYKDASGNYVTNTVLPQLSVNGIETKVLK